MEKPYIKWYESEELAIFLDKMPIVLERYVTPFSTDEEIEDVKKLPFICSNGVRVAIFDHLETEIYKFTIPNNYKWDGASIPKFFHRLIGANTDNNFLIGSMIHDFICENKKAIKYDKSLSTNILNACLITAKVNSIKRFLIKNSVALWQTLVCDWADDENY